MEEMKKVLERGDSDIWVSGRSTKNGDEMAKAFLQLIPQYPDCKIETISVDHIKGITGVGAQELGKAIPLIPKVKKLILSTSKSGVVGAIAKGAAESHSLEHIALSNNSSIGPEEIKLFSDNNLPSLRVLKLCNNRLGDDCMPFVATLLRKTRTLETLVLSPNRITDTGPIADALGLNSTLQTLELSRNSLSDSGVRGLARALFHNTRLKALDLTCNQLTDHGEESARRFLMTALSHNRTVESLWVHGNDMSDEMQTEIQGFAMNRQERRRRMVQRLSLVLLSPEAINSA